MLLNSCVAVWAVENIGSEVINEQTHIESRACDNTAAGDQDQDQDHLSDWGIWQYKSAYLNVSGACDTFPPRHASFASAFAQREPWFLWSNATAMRPVLSDDARWFQSLIQLAATPDIIAFSWSLG